MQQRTRVSGVGGRQLEGGRRVLAHTRRSRVQALEQTTELRWQRGRISLHTGPEKGFLEAERMGRGFPSLPQG